MTVQSVYKIKDSLYKISYHFNPLCHTERSHSKARYNTLLHNCIRNPFAHNAEESQNFFVDLKRIF